MSIAREHEQPLRLSAAINRDVRTQFGAICYRVRKDKVQVLLITSRGTGRWVIPKGWPIAGATPSKSAEREAWEEAGVIGTARPVCLGVYSYTKRDDSLSPLPCVVAVFPVKVRKLEDKFPEAGERRRKWCSPKKAAALLQEPELAQIISRFDPRHL